MDNDVEISAELIFKDCKIILHKIVTVKSYSSSLFDISIRGNIGKKELNSFVSHIQFEDMPDDLQKAITEQQPIP